MTDEGFRETEIPDPYVGTVVQNKFRFIRKLGEGGMGSVYEGLNTSIQRKVAIKCLHSHLARDANVVYRFRNEAVAAAKIGNEHIVDVLDMGQLPDGAYFLVLEFLDGTDLAGLLDKEGILPVGRVVRIVRQVLSALGAAHQSKIVHRDIKPENVFLVRRSSGDDFVKLLDFGIAKVDGDTTSMRTATGTQLGTPYYMPPEQAMGHKDIDSRADLYATGVMIYHCLTGRFPFEGDSLPMLMYRLCHTDATPLLTYRPDLPADLAAIVMRTISKNRDERPATAEELSALLEPFAKLDTPAPTRTEVNSRSASDTGAIPAASGAESAASEPKTHKTTLGASASMVDIDQRVRRESASPKLPMVIGAAVVAAIGVVGAVTVAARSGSNTGTQNQTGPATQPTPDPRGADPNARSAGTSAVDRSADSGVASAPAAPERRVAVQISTFPEVAELRFDGRPINNPYDGDVVVSDDVHRLEVVAPGFRTEVRMITVTERQRIVVRLERGTGRVIVQANGQRVRDNGSAPLPPTTDPAPRPSGTSANPTSQPSAGGDPPQNHGTTQAHGPGTGEPSTAPHAGNAGSAGSSGAGSNSGSTTNPGTANPPAGRQVNPTPGTTPTGMLDPEG
ncbi:MAG: protein kinase [Myxococcales bacterium]|nr:protein kinase [Myxococcales bacterium]